MKLNFVLGCVFAFIAGAAQGQAKNTGMKATEESVTCKLTTAELQKRKATVIAELKALVLERKELSDGYSYKFDAVDQNLDRLNEFIKTERMCCDFFTFQIKVSDNFATLSITGENNSKEFLKSEIDL